MPSLMLIASRSLLSRRYVGWTTPSKEDGGMNCTERGREASVDLSKMTQTLSRSTGFASKHIPQRPTSYTALQRQPFKSLQLKNKANKERRLESNIYNPSFFKALSKNNRPQTQAKSILKRPSLHHQRGLFTVFPTPPPPWLYLISSRPPTTTCPVLPLVVQIETPRCKVVLAQALEPPLRTPYPLNPSSLNPATPGRNDKTEQHPLPPCLSNLLTSTPPHSAAAYAYDSAP